MWNWKPSLDPAVSIGQVPFALKVPTNIQLTRHSPEEWLLCVWFAPHAERSANEDVGKYHFVYCHTAVVAVAAAAKSSRYVCQAYFKGCFFFR